MKTECLLGKGRKRDAPGLLRCFGKKIFAEDLDGAM